jgi:FAD/FMN-containing dehydrogenase
MARHRSRSEGRWVRPHSITWRQIKQVLDPLNILNPRKIFAY